ncbi:MAG: hypothetical protein AB1778_07365 [Candidatus Bipolaricaulota bacterium]
MNRAVAAGLLAVLCLACVGAAQDAVAVEAPNENLSLERGFGLGLQAGFPWGGLVSARYWATERFGIEGVGFVLVNDGETAGVLTARGLFRAVDAASVDFYLAGGVSFRFTSFGSPPPLAMVVGGIEINFSQRFAWNVEFGLSATAYGEIWTTFGTGLHFYF